MAALIPSTAFVPRTITLGLTRHDRKAIERQIEALIALLDAIDGDPDLEDDELHDDPLDVGEEVDFYAMLPRYALDQTEGPINAREARYDHDLRHYGFAR